MNTNLHSKKTWIWLIIIVVVAGLAYFYFSGSSAPASSGTLDVTDSDALIGTQVLSLLNQIQSLRIDTSIFNDPGYKTLRDYSVVIPPVNVGRPNPFAPLGPSVSTGASAGGANAGANTAGQ